MDDLSQERCRRLILIILCLCISSLVICEVIDPLFASEKNWYIYITDGFLQETHIDEHDDDFVLIELNNENIALDTMDRNRSSNISVASCSLSPLLPPPKA